MSSVPDGLGNGCVLVCDDFGIGWVRHRMVLAPDVFGLGQFFVCYRLRLGQIDLACKGRGKCLKGCFAVFFEVVIF